MGSLAVVDVSAETGVQPQPRLVFDQVAYRDQDRPERLQGGGGFELVEWYDWFALLDEAGLALVVLPEQPGVLDNTRNS